MEKNMGYSTKIQKVDRPTNQSYSVNLPTALAQSFEIEKGEEFEWIIENKNLLLLKRVIPAKKRDLKNG
jgi:antitoxin component of MazEF toxin-antitoxin module